MEAAAALHARPQTGVSGDDLEARGFLPRGGGSGILIGKKLKIGSPETQFPSIRGNNGLAIFRVPFTRNVQKYGSIMHQHLG